MFDQFTGFLWSNTWQLAVCALVFYVLERAFAAVPSQRALRQGVLVDVFFSYGVVLLSLPIYLPAMHWIGGLLQQHAQFAWLHHFRQWVAALGGAGQFLIMLVVADFLSYWRHRLFHWGWFWPFHAVHHSAEEVDWLTNERFHPIDHATGQVLQAASFLVIGFDPGTVAVHAVLRRGYSLFIHSNVRISYGRLGYVFASPAFHRWHHSADPRTWGKNYAVVFSAFDWMFGSWVMPEGEPTTYGLGDVETPKGVIALLLHPFRRPRPAAVGAEATLPGA